MSNTVTTLLTVPNANMFQITIDTSNNKLYAANYQRNLVKVDLTTNAYTDVFISPNSTNDYYMVRAAFFYEDYIYYSLRINGVETTSCIWRIPTSVLDGQEYLGVESDFNVKIAEIPYANFILISDDKMYVSCGAATETQGKIARIEDVYSYSDTEGTDLDWVTGIVNPNGIVIDYRNSEYNLYVGNASGSDINGKKIIKISDINGETPTVTPDYITGLASAVIGLFVDETSGYLYASLPDSTNGIIQVNLSTGTVSNASWAVTASLSGFSGLAMYNNKLYAGYFDGSIGTFGDMVCFKEDTQILTDDGYKLIQNLRDGDLVKTLKHGYVPISMIAHRKIRNIGIEERIKDQLYVCSKTNFPEVFEDLVITGGHSILVDNFKDDKQMEENKKAFGGKNHMTDDKYRLLVFVDDRTTIYNKKETVTIYHIALENDDSNANYGIYANGLLVETCSKNHLKKKSNMSLIK